MQAPAAPGGDLDTASAQPLWRGWLDTGLDRITNEDFWIPAALLLAALMIALTLGRVLLRIRYGEKLRYERRRFKAYFAERLNFEKARRELEAPGPAADSARGGARRPGRP
jgi:hypothetical protein